MSTHTISLSFQMHVHDSHPALPGSHNIFSHIAIFPNKYLVYLISCSCLLAPYRTWVKTAFLSSLCRRLVWLQASSFMIALLNELNSKCILFPFPYFFRPSNLPHARGILHACHHEYILYSLWFLLEKNTKSIKMSRLNKIGICLYNYKP